MKVKVYSKDSGHTKDTGIEKCSKNGNVHGITYNQGVEIPTLRSTTVKLTIVESTI